MNTNNNLLMTITVQLTKKHRKNLKIHFQTFQQKNKRAKSIKK